MKRYWYALSVPTYGWQEHYAVQDVILSSETTMGERVEEFEEQFARYVGARYAVMVNSGSSADMLMAFACRDEDPRVRPTVLIPAVTWPTHVWSWHIAGFHIRFVDVDGVNTNSRIISDARRNQYDMVSVPHLMGIPADIWDLDDSMPITEDCCESLGASVGNVGEMATWSFFFSHQMTTMEGGAITTDDPDVANSLRSLRSHGWARHEGKNPYEFVGMGFNVRPTEMSAAIGLVQLRRLDEFNKLRADNRQRFVEALDGCPGLEFPAVPEAARPSWFGLPMFVDDRDGLAEFLEDQGVETRPILGGNLTRQPAFKRWAGGQLPGADRVHDHGLYIGLHPLADCGIEEVALAIRRYLG